MTGVRFRHFSADWLAQNSARGNFGGTCLEKTRTGSARLGRTGADQRTGGPASGSPGSPKTRLGVTSGSLGSGSQNLDRRVFSELFGRPARPELGSESLRSHLSRENSGRGHFGFTSGSLGSRNLGSLRRPGSPRPRLRVTSGSLGSPRTRLGTTSEPLRGHLARPELGSGSLRGHFGITWLEKTWLEATSGSLGSRKIGSRTLRAYLA